MRDAMPLPLPVESDELAISDKRQSPLAAGVQRGVCRLLKAHGFATLTELPLATGRRVDVMAINGKGAVWVVEIKSCLADLRADAKWPEYEGWCDRLYFAVPPDMPLALMPQSQGLIIADQWGAEIVKESPERSLAPARRRAVTLRFARTAALRLHGLHDPGA